MVPFRLLTNNSTLTPDQNGVYLRRMGIVVDVADILTSALATAAYLHREGAAGQTAYVVGEAGLQTALVETGLVLADSSSRVDWVVVGLDRRLTYRKLEEAALALQRGARFVASNSDLSLPVEDGLIPGAGAILAAITATTGCRPLVIGKPEPRMLELAMKALGGTVRDTAMLGDRLDTDVEAAARANMTSILALTGVSTRQDLARSSIQPDLVVDDLPELLRLWDRSRPGVAGVKRK